MTKLLGLENKEETCENTVEGRRLQIRYYKSTNRGLGISGFLFDTGVSINIFHLLYLM